MTIQVIESEYCKLSVHVEIDSEIVKTKRNELIDKIKEDKTIKIPGFRPGKATREAILVSKKDGIKQKLMSDLSQEAYTDFLFEHKVKPLFNPQVQAMDLNDDNFWCDLVVFKAPDFELADYTKMSIPKPDLKSTLEADVNLALENLRVQHGEYAPFGDNDVVGSGDTLTLSIKCFKNEVVGGTSWEEWKEMSKDGILHHVGEAPELESHLIGMKINETKEFQLPSDEVASYLGPQYQGMHLKFEVQVFMGLKTTPCPLDDSLAQKFNMDNFDQLHQTIVGMITKKRQEQEQFMLHQQIMSRLLEDNKFKIPDWLLDEEKRHLAAKGESKSTEELNKKAEEAVRLSFILDAVRSNEPDVSFSNEELLVGLKNKIDSSGGDGNKYLQEANKNKTLPKLIAGLRDTITLDHIASKVNMIE